MAFMRAGNVFRLWRCELPLPHNRDDWVVVHLWRDLWRAQQGDSQGVGVSLRLSMFGWMCETRRARDK